MPKPDTPFNSDPSPTNFCAVTIPEKDALPLCDIVVPEPRLKPVACRKLSPIR